MTKLLFALAVVTFATASAHADIVLFQAHRQPVRIDADLSLSSSAFAAGDLNRGTAAQEVVRFIDGIKERFGLREVNGEVLNLRNRHGSPNGFSLRFIQRYNRVHVEGAELLAIFDNDGRLRSLNSSLVSTPPITVNPELSRADAFRVAVNELGYNDPEAGEDAHDGLLIVNRDGRPLLVWQFSIREHADMSKPYSVQIVAQGPNKGRVNRVLSLAHTAGDGDVSIYDASVTLVTPNPLFKGVKVLKNGRPTLAGHVLVSNEAKNADRNLQRVREFYSRVFGRKSYDSRGSDIDASVNVQKIQVLDILGMRQNAAWMGPWKMFIFGAGGNDLADFTGALDVVGHEFTHAVIGSTSNLEYLGQSGALNESLADVFGAVIHEQFEKPAEPFLIGASVLRGDLRKKAPALRDMRNPERGLRPQPASMDQFPEQFKNCKAASGNDNCGVHTLSGIPNKAAALLIERIGWEPARNLIYKVMTARLRSSSDFADYRNQLVDECRASLNASDCEAVKDAFGQVGL